MGPTCQLLLPSSPSILSLLHRPLFFINRGKQAGDDDVEMAEGRNNKVADGGGFGMVLLEMLTGMRALDTGRPALQHSLVEWAKPYLADRRKLAWLVDPRLEGQYPSRAAQQAAQLTLRCLSGDPRSRPSMAEVVAQRPPVLPRRHPLQPTSSSLSRRPLQPASSPLRRPGAGER
uniref:Serine/threonine protein kinase-like protein n=1 Tax=Oryza sativa subsp. japonica TaxID=39947 RepID=Q69LG6_ORYSJ|nr:serine/threonine protein kinase-like protein [Oryza sativa Japonica Group]